MNKISQILESNNLNQLFFVFFNLAKEDDNGFQIKISYRTSKYTQTEITKQIVSENNNNLINRYDLPFSVKGKSSHIVYLQNDTNLVRQEILDKIYSRTQQLRFSYTDTQYESKMLTSIFVPRGSVDLTLNYFAVDLIKENIYPQYISNVMSLVSSTDAIRQLNLNFRELQPQFVSDDKKRETQLRVNLRWFYERYLEEVESINLYKAAILRDSTEKILVRNVSKTIEDKFIQRALFYRENIVGARDKLVTLSDDGMKKEITNLRDELNFNDADKGFVNEISRKSDIVKLAIISHPDECVACKNKYDLMDRTFMWASKKRPYLEIHHVISFGADKKGDILENLVKLCPACHRALTPGRAEISYQKDLIGNILDNSVTANEYVSRFLNVSVTREEKIDYVFNKLR